MFVKISPAAEINPECIERIERFDKYLYITLISGTHLRIDDPDVRQAILAALDNTLDPTDPLVVADAAANASVTPSTFFSTLKSFFTR